MYGDQFNLSFFSVSDPSPAVGPPYPFVSDSFASPASTLDTYVLAGNDLVSAYGIMNLLNSEMLNCCNSDSGSYASEISPASFESRPPSLVKRSGSFFSIQNNGFERRDLSPFYQLFQSEGVYSGGDAQMVKHVTGKNDGSKSLSSNESESSIIIRGMGKASPYSAEEKKERIERYRSKRNQRNFCKKIKYECRKTLADNRIRVKGRFARNEEIEKNSWSGAIGDEENDSDYENDWINFVNAIPPRI